MRLVLICLGLVVSLLCTPPAMAQSYRDRVIQSLTDQGFSNFRVRRTWLGYDQIIALGPDGRREVVLTPVHEDEAQAARVFNLARQDVAGYEDYARRVRAMFDDTRAPLTDLLEGLFHIAVSDGSYHPAEDEFLRNVAAIFGLDDRQFLALRTRFVPDADKDPYSVLGVSPDMPLAEIRRIWRQAVRDSHPDRMIARGVPEEAVRMSEKRLIDINKAWEEIQASQSEPA